MFKFTTRAQARSFKAKNVNYQVVDLGSNTVGKRWGVRVMKTKV